MIIEKPIFILGSQRSGTTWLARAFEQHPNVAYWHEPRYVWIWGNFKKPDDLLTAKDLNPKIKKHIIRKFSQFLHQQEKQRLCEKTPSNCLRISFIRAVFPDAKIILLLRDGRSVLRSTRQSLVTQGGLGLNWTNVRRKIEKVPPGEWYLLLPRIGSFIKKLLGLKIQFAGVKPPGWQEWIGQTSANVLLAKQWATTIEIAVKEGRKLPTENYLELRYEELISAPPELLKQLANFVEIENFAPISDYIDNTADPPRAYQWKSELEQTTLDEIREIMEPTLVRLGYSWE
ncbi:MAG: sulfotransferase [Cyanobacteriota bacterium]|nr:sulfotransferase [Cyanobacteriota bacterium]